MNNSNYNAYGGYDDGFSSVGVVALWVLSVTGVFSSINFCVRYMVICVSTQSYFSTVITRKVLSSYSKDSRSVESFQSQLLHQRKQV